jgi:hypothetical protein
VQKTLTSVETCGRPSARQVAGEPVAEMLVALGLEKAPFVRWRQTVNVPLVQSALVVH